MAPRRSGRISSYAREWARPVGGIYVNFLYDDLVPYHLDVRPHETSDLVVELPEARS